MRAGKFDAVTLSPSKTVPSPSTIVSEMLNGSYDVTIPMLARDAPKPTPHAIVTINVIVANPRTLLLKVKISPAQASRHQQFINDNFSPLDPTGDIASIMTQVSAVGQ